MRWASIPGDGTWDARRALWATAAPSGAAAMLMVQFYGVAAAWPTKLLLAPLLALPLVWALRRRTSATEPPRALTAFVVSGFCMCIVWLNLLATEVVALIEAAGFLLGISTSILGLTVIAIGNSSGDLVGNIAAARGASAKMGIAACFGSPLLMNLIGAGAALSLRMAVTGGAPIPASISQICRIGYLFLYLSMGCHMLVFPLCGYAATRRYASRLRFTYDLGEVYL